MNVKEINKGLIELLKVHCQSVQSGKFGNVDIKDLTFIGKIHSLIEGFEE